MPLALLLLSPRKKLRGHKTVIVPVAFQETIGQSQSPVTHQVTTWCQEVCRGGPIRKLISPRPPPLYFFAFKTLVPSQPAGFERSPGLSSSFQVGAPLTKKHFPAPNSDGLLASLCIGHANLSSTAKLPPSALRFSHQESGRN